MVKFLIFSFTILIYKHFLYKNISKSKFSCQHNEHSVNKKDKYSKTIQQY